MSLLRSDDSAELQIIERKNAVLSSNNSTVSENEKLIQGVVDVMLKKLAEFGQLSRKRLANLENDAQGLRSLETQTLTAHTELINQHFERVEELFQQIEETNGAENQSLKLVRQEIKNASTAFKSSVTSWSETLTSSTNEICSKSASETKEQLTVLDNAIGVLYKLSTSIAQEAKKYLVDEASELDEMFNSTRSFAEQEVARLTRQNEILAEMVVNERAKSEKAKDELILRISSMLGDFVQKRDQELKESIGHLQRSNQEVEDLLASTYNQQSALRESISTRSGKLSEDIKTYEDEAARAKADAIQVMAVFSIKILLFLTPPFVRLHAQPVNRSKDRSNACKASSSNRLHLTQIRSNNDHNHWRSQWVMVRFVPRIYHCVLRLTFATAFDEHSRAKRARLEATNHIRTAAKAHQNTQQNMLASTSQKSKKFTSQVMSSVGLLYIIVNVFRILTAINSLDFRARAALNSIRKLYRIATQRDRISHTDHQENGHQRRYFDWVDT